MFLSETNILGPCLTQFSVTPSVFRIGGMVLEKTYTLIQLMCYFLKLLIFFAEHGYIRIIIPRDITFMTNRPQESSAAYNVMDPFLLAQPIKFHHHLKLNQLHFSDIFRWHFLFSHFYFHIRFHPYTLPQIKKLPHFRDSLNVSSIASMQLKHSLYCIGFFRHNLYIVLLILPFFIIGHYLSYFVIKPALFSFFVIKSAFLSFFVMVFYDLL